MLTSSNWTCFIHLRRISQIRTMIGTTRKKDNTKSAFELTFCPHSAVVRSLCMTMIHLIATIALAGSFSTIVAFTGITRSPVISSSSSRARLFITALNEKKCNIESTRRETLRAAAISTAFLVNNNKALAFPNKISTKYDDRPKQRGSKVRVFVH